MKAEELMKPRYEVIADFPNNTLSIGFIVNQENLKVIDMIKYPHLFRKLNWWEKRNVHEMPKRLICKAIPGDTEIIEIQEWDMDRLIGWRNKVNRTCCSLHSFNPEYGYFPVD